MPQRPENTGLKDLAAVPDTDSDEEWNSPPPTITPLGRLLRLAASGAQVPNGPVASHHGLSLIGQQRLQAFVDAATEHEALGAGVLSINTPAPASVPAPPALVLSNVDPIAVASAAPLLAPAIFALARALPVAADPALFVFPRLPGRTELYIQNVCTPAVAGRSLIGHAGGLPPRGPSPRVPPATTNDKGCWLSASRAQAHGGHCQMTHSGIPRMTTRAGRGKGLWQSGGWLAFTD
ncbi:hypothetical protein MMC22_009850 [Lobaria immixta]|nr:hypothetical protein [Lobaria immixta]